MVLEDDILTIEYNKPIFNTEGLELTEPEQFIIDQLNSCVKIRMNNKDIDFIHDYEEHLSWYNAKNKDFYLNYKHIWSVLEKKYCYNVKNLIDLNINLMLKVFKCKVITSD